jgi:hypothetical protein
MNLGIDLAQPCLDCARYYLLGSPQEMECARYYVLSQHHSGSDPGTNSQKLATSKEDSS